MFLYLISKDDTFFPPGSLQISSQYSPILVTCNFFDFFLIIHFLLSGHPGGYNFVVLYWYVLSRSPSWRLASSFILTSWHSNSLQELLAVMWCIVHRWRNKLWFVANAFSVIHRGALEFTIVQECSIWKCYAVTNDNTSILDRQGSIHEGNLVYWEKWSPDTNQVDPVTSTTFSRLLIYMWCSAEMRYNIGVNMSLGTETTQGS